MIVKMRFLNISGPRDDIDRVCEKYLSKYEMQIENAVTELKTTENIMPFVEVNPYRDPLAKAEQFAQLLPEDREIRADLSGSKDDMLALIRDLNHDYLGLMEERERLKLKKEELLGKENVLKPFSALKVDVHKALQYQYMPIVLFLAIILFEMSEILIPVVYSSLHAPTGILYYTSII